ncbi:3'(2'),5'-bisphosphate nucleotidase CysQ [Gemmobacter serpentinus]|uniref:3'(2'),5'-bisphosphate nucleotidase CysQ n=1 Tax=Gemmobacter serpentinus TaxID=2652247 RepID=UPI00124F6DA6|nr:3'(2'),5'-bisphosphate nucleotidase CysQ [Gemmobacter serpentinus]
MPESDLALLTEAALQAGHIARGFWRQAPQVWEKPGLGPVTEADLAVNTHLRGVLRAARPDYGWLSEEDPDDTERLHAGRVFVLDPIDGTRAFIAGEESFAISIAVIEDGLPVTALVYLPARDRLYTATAHGPALCDGQPIQASTRAGLEGATLLATSPTMAPDHWPGGVPEVKRSFRASLAYRMCLVAEGRYDAMLTLRPAWEWDIAAGALIAARAGAVVTDRQGHALQFNNPHPQSDGVIAAPLGLHSALRAGLDG